MGVATEIVGITPEGRKASDKMKQDTVRVVKCKVDFLVIFVIIVTRTSQRPDYQRRAHLASGNKVSKHPEQNHHNIVNSQYVMKQQEGLRISI